MKKHLLVIYLTAVVLLAASPAGAGEPDWSGIRGKNLPLFYLGLTSWEFLISPEDHSLGGKNIKRAKSNCQRCHLSDTGELDLRVAEIASGTLKMKLSQKPFEPEPIAGKAPLLGVTLRVAYDDEYIYFKAEWPSRGSSANDPALAKKGLADRISIQINKDHDLFKKYGCYITCHDDVNTMPGSPAADKVKKHPYYASAKRDDTRLYALYTRDGGWDKFVKKAELAKLSASGLIDIWEVELAGAEAKVVDGWIFEDRQADKSQDVTVKGSWQGGKYTVVLKRKLNTGDPKDVQFKHGEAFTIGISVHDNKSSSRKHYVSFSHSIGLGAAAEFGARKIK